MKKTMYIFGLIIFNFLLIPLSLSAELADPVDTAIGVNANYIKVGKINNDSHLDLIATLLGSRTIYIYHGDGTGLFNLDKSIVIETTLRAIEVDDFNKDGYLDFIITRARVFFPGDLFSVYINDGIGNFNTTGDLALSQSLAVTGSNLTNQGGWITVAALSSFGAIAVSRSNQVTNYFAPAVINTLSHADMDHDGNEDIIGIHTGGNNLSVFWGNGIGTNYFYTANIDVGSMPADVTVADYNLDDKDDLVIANQGTQSISTILNQNSRSAFTTQDTAIGVAINRVQSGDINLDGLTDIVASSQSDSALVIIEGDGVGGFSPLPLIPLIAAPLSLSLGDVDGDGKIDVVTSHNDGNVAVRFNISIPPAITFANVFPSTIGNNGRVNIRIIGAGFLTGVTVLLRRLGSVDITANEVLISAQGKIIQASFDLNSASLGDWDIVVTNPLSPPLVLSAAITMEMVSSAQFWADIVGRTVARVSRPAKYSIVYGNRGNVNLSGALLWLRGIPSTANVRVNFDNLVSPTELLPSNPEFALMQNNVEKVVPIQLGEIPPSFTGVLTVEITNLSTDAFTLKLMKVAP